MIFSFEGRPSDSPLVEGIWRTYSIGGGSFTSSAASNFEMVITKQKGVTTLTLRGPETLASPAPVPEDAEFFGITFKLGTYMPHLPASSLVNGSTNLPELTNQSFWLLGMAWQFPNYENADTFVSRLVREGLLVRDEAVGAVLEEQPPAWSERTLRRRFLQSTGLTYKAIQQIERARRAMAMLEQGTSIFDTVFELGYFDQPHMTKALKHFIGRTPAQILRLNDPE